MEWQSREDIKWQNSQHKIVNDLKLECNNRASALTHVKVIIVSAFE